MQGLDGKAAKIPPRPEFEFPPLGQQAIAALGAL